ncbi:hypothetical protein [Longispora urticae]
MRAMLGTLSDRLLGAFVPKANVGAGCPPDPFYKYCYCSGNYQYEKHCSTNGACITFCGSCYRTTRHC